MVQLPTPLESDLEEFDRTTASFLRGDYSIPGYEVLYLYLIANRKYEAYVKYLRDNPKITLSIDAPPKAKAGETVTVEVIVGNQTGAHVVPSGPIDLNEHWIELIVETPAGQRLFESGLLTQDGYLPEDVVRFGGTPLDDQGKPIEHHRFWNTVSVGDVRKIAVRGSYRQAYAIPIPAEISGEILIKASFCYRRYNQAMADWVYGADGTTFPVHRYHSASVRLIIE